jgi:hypothetical protein
VDNDNIVSAEFGGGSGPSNALETDRFVPKAVLSLSIELDDGDDPIEALRTISDSAPGTVVSIQLYRRGPSFF